MTFIEKFDTLKKKYGTVDESKLTESFAIQIEMTDDDCKGIFYVAYMNGVFAVEPYDYHDRTAAITATSKVLESVLSGKTTPVKAYTDGKLIVDGNLDHALMLVELMKKVPAKKAATKKSTKKAEESKPEAKAEVKEEVKAETPKAETKKETPKAEAKKSATKKTTKK